MDSRLHKIVVMDAEEGLRSLPPHSIDLIVTSPPYWDLRNYSEHTKEVGHEKSVEAYITRLSHIFATAKAALKPTGSVWVNIGETYRDGRPLHVPTTFMFHMLEVGYTLRNTVIWYKPDSMSESTTKRFSQKWEPFYWFTHKDAPEYYFDLEASKIPVTRSFAERLEHKFNTDNEDVSRMRGLQGDASAKIEQYLAKGVNAGDVWMIPKDKDKTGHPAPFPVTLAARPIVTTCPRGGIVYDPFAGSGTVGVATYRLGGGRSFTGTDISEEWAALGNKRIEQERQEGSLF
jgi:DNA modification methylase